MPDDRLKAQLRLEEIEGELEHLHVEMTETWPLPVLTQARRAILVRVETDLRRERAYLTGWLGS